MNRNAKLMKKEKDDSELIKLACQVSRLRALQGKTDKQSIIRELSLAQFIASDEIIEEERKDGDIYSMPWNQFSDVDLQRKLRQYETALRKKGMKDIGKRAFEELVEKEMEKQEK